MAVPKKRTGHSAQGHRRSNWKATTPETTKCPTCGATVLTHTVCTECGNYKGKPVSLKDRKEEVVKEEKPAKKSTKKAAEPKEETKVEAKEETKEAEKVEEVKAEETAAEEEVKAEEFEEKEEK